MAKKTIPTVGEVMTPYPIVVHLNDHVTTARELMESHGIRHLPVLSEGKPVSVVSDREIQAALALMSGEQMELRVGDVCAMEGYIVDTSTPLDVVLQTMTARKLGSVLVTKDSRTAGIFTAVDACRELLKHLQS